ncbi:MAG: adenylate/guanylate cyclase domain-containing protein [Burkholderiaceae bacterium]
MGSRFCNGCGQPLDDGQRAAPEAGQLAERKQVSVLFSDLTGFTALTEKLDPEETRQIIGRVFEMASDIVGRYEGRIEKFVGDAIMAIFGVPLAHEDDPQRAIRAALELHDAVDAMSPGIEARTGVCLSMHSGVNTGVVVTGELQFEHGTAGPLGDTINTAARLMNGAASGEIWVGPETIHLVANSFDLEDLGKMDFKGKASAISVSRVIAVREVTQDAVARKMRAEFVGRHTELGALLDASERIQDGEGQILSVCGDAGAGKTRLIAEFRRKLASNVQWIEGRAYPFATDTPYGLFLDLLNRAWQIEVSDPPARVRAKVIAGMQAVLGKDDDAQALYLHLYGLNQDVGVVVEREAFRDQLLAATRRMLSKLATRGPLIACFQDLHWADPSSVRMLVTLSANPLVGVLILGNYRPEFTPAPGMNEIRLAELSSRQSGELLTSLLGAEPPELLTDFVSERCDGNPFYVEEVVNALVETGVLVKAGGQIAGDRSSTPTEPATTSWTLVGPLTESTVPATIRGVIAARIDRLETSRRQLLRHAAVVGREFLVKVVGLIGASVVDLTPGMAHLQAADLIRLRHAEPDLAYMFKHALTQDVAYEGLLKSDRQQLHARCAQAIEEVFAERLPEVVETLAFHYQRGGVPDKAIPYLVAAGRKCVDRYALTEASRHYQEAYDLLPSGNLTQTQQQVLTDLLIAWSQVHYYEGTINTWHALLEKHLGDARQCGDGSLLVRYLGWLGNVRCFVGDFNSGLTVLDEAYALGTNASAHDDLAIICGWRAFALVEATRYDEATGLVDQTNFSDEHRVQPSYYYAKAQAARVFGLYMKGQFARGDAIIEELATSGRTNGNARAESLARNFMGIRAWMTLDFDGAIVHSQGGQECARDPLFSSMNVNNEAIGHMMKLEPAPAAQLCADHLAYTRDNGNQWTGRHLQFPASAAALAQGDLSNGLRDFLGLIEQASQAGMRATSTLASALLVNVYTTVARFDIMPGPGHLAANPWFVFTQAPFAAGKARALARQLRADATATDSAGIFLLLDYAEARLLAHRRKKKDAALVLARIRSQLRAAGTDHDPAAVVALTQEIEK